MYDLLILLHVLAAFALIASVVVYSSIALGGPATNGLFRAGSILWDVGGIGTIVLGIALTIDVDGYGFLDFWILASIVLWMLATETGRRANIALAPAPAEGTDGGALRLSAESTAVAMHWLRSAIAIAILVLMIVKPGA